MAYGSYFPISYQPNYFGQQNPYFQQPQQQTQQNQHQTVQQSGFVLVRSEQEARSYPVAPGNSVTFKDESRPYCYVKTMGFNQFDQPMFERYRLVKEEIAQAASESSVEKDSKADNKDTVYALKSDLDAIWGEIEALKEKSKIKAQTKVKRIVEVEADEDEE